MSRHDRTINGIKYEDYPATKKEAILNDFKYFFTGKPCKHGHIAPRNLTRGNCYDCQSIKGEAYIKTDVYKLVRKRSKAKQKAEGKFHTPEYMEKQRKRAAEWRKHEHNKEHTKAYLKKNKKWIRERTKKWEEKNKEIIAEKRRIYHQTPQAKLLLKAKTQKRRANPEIRLMMNIRDRIRHFLKSTKDTSKQVSTIDLLGCDKKYLIKHLGKQFVEGMSMDNLSKWHVDHIIPLSFFHKYFDISDLLVQKIAFHHSNLQPLFPEDNISKNDRIYIDHPDLKNRKIIVNVKDEDQEVFVSLLIEEVEKKIQILKDKNTVKDVGKITNNVIKKFYDLVDEPIEKAPYLTIK